MTTLAITPNYDKKRLKFSGTVAAGEHVAVTVSGGADWIKPNQSSEGQTLRLRVIFGDKTVAVFPLWTAENEDDWPDGVVSADEWETAGSGNADAVCELNLNSIPAEKYLKFGGNCLWVLDDTENHTLYGMGEFEVGPWPKRAGIDEPIDLDGYPQLVKDMADLKVAWADYKRDMDAEVAAQDASISALETGKADKSDTYTKSEVNDLVASATPSDYEQVKEQVAQNAADITAIDAKIPSQASAQNQLADKDFVNSSIATNTATFRGTYNLVSALGLSVAQKDSYSTVGAALKTYLDAQSVTQENNDYCFIQIPTADATPTEIARIDRYKCVVTVSGGVGATTTSWEYEYSLNNSGFTAAQWAAINSGITSGLVEKLNDLPTAAGLALLFAGKLGNSGSQTLNGKLFVKNNDDDGDPRILAGDTTYGIGFNENNQLVWYDDGVKRTVNVPTSGGSYLARIADITDALAGYVPTSRTVNGKALSSNVTLYGSDIPVTSASGADTIDTALGKKLGNTGDQALNGGSLIINKMDTDGGVWLQLMRESQPGIGLAFQGIRTLNGFFITVPEKDGRFALLADTLRFSTGVSYAVGNVVFYNGSFYRCKAAHTAGAWNASHFEEVIGGLSTGTPTAPTPTAGDDSTKIATTAFVQAAVAGATPNLDYVMRVNPETGEIYYTTPDTNANA